MLRQRVITALILLPVVVAAIFFLPTAALYVVLALAGLLVAWEWSALAGFETPASRGSYVAVTALLLVVLWPLQFAWWALAALAVGWWLIMLVIIPGFPDNVGTRPPGSSARAIVGFILLSATVLSLAHLHATPQGPLRVLYLMVLVWAADTGAYFAGRRFGRNKLAPRVSPGKTWEGFAGGMALCLVWALAAGLPLFAGGPVGRVPWLLAFNVVILSLATALLSVVGDLGISLFKRLAKVKDTGSLLPGHGGLLDRVDSLLAAAPALTLGVVFLHF